MSSGAGLLGEPQVEFVDVCYRPIADVRLSRAELARASINVAGVLSIPTIDSNRTDERDHSRT